MRLTSPLLCRLRWLYLLALFTLSMLRREIAGAESPPMRVHRHLIALVAMGGAGRRQRDPAQQAGSRGGLLHLRTLLSVWLVPGKVCRGRSYRTGEVLTRAS